MSIHRDAELVLFWEEERVSEFRVELRAVLEGDSSVSLVHPEEKTQDALLLRFLQFGEGGKRGKRIASVCNAESGDLGLEVVTMLNLRPRKNLVYEDVVDRAMIEASSAGYSLKVSRG